MDKDIALLVITSLFAVFGYLLRQKDMKQEEQIKGLQEDHVKDSERLRVLELKLAEEYHKKDELNGIVNSLRQSFRDGIAEVTARLDKMQEMMMDHVIGSKKNGN